MNKTEIVFAIRSELQFVQNMGYFWKTRVELPELEKAIQREFVITPAHIEYMRSEDDRDALLKISLDAHRDEIIAHLKEHHAKATRTD